MLFEDASDRIRRYNQLCLHYNLVADSVYRELSRTESPFSPEYQPYLTAALISFDMGRMMGKGLANRYDIAADGFAARLHRKMSQVKRNLEPIIYSSLLEVDITEHNHDIAKAYEVLASDGHGSLHEQEKRFHVGTTKILHFLNPELFMIVDKNTAMALEIAYGIPYGALAQPGYSAQLYTRSLSVVRQRISDYGIERFRSLEPGTPTIRVFDKLAFAFTNSW